jgi:D-lactate dehydrogenase
MDPNLLNEILLFRECHPETLEQIARVAARRVLQTGEALFEEGDPGEFMFAVESGHLSVRKRSPSGDDVQLRIMTPGDVGGLTSMTTDKLRSASLTALGESRVVTVPKAEFQRILRSRSDLSESMISFLAAKVRGKTQRLATLMSGPVGGGTPVAFFDAKRYDEDSFSSLGASDLAFEYFEPKLSPRTAALAAGHPVVCAFVNDDLGADVLRALADQGVGLVAMRCAGFNNVDVGAAQELGISLVRVPAYSPHAVAEHAVALMMALNRKTHRAYNRVREGNFSLSGLVGIDFHGRTAGIVGLGKIGRCLVDILLGFGMEVLAYDAFPDAAYAERTGIRYATLDELLAASDVVSLHAPLMPETYHLIDGPRVARMKRGAMLINTSRGGLVDAAALIEGLKSGQVGAAGLDVYEEESEYFFEDRSDRVIADDLLARLMTFNNVMITSHQAFLTTDALSNIASTTVDNIREWIAGERGEGLTNAILPSA